MIVTAAILPLLGAGAAPPRIAHISVISPTSKSSESRYMYTYAYVYIRAYRNVKIHLSPSHYVYTRT